MSAIKELKKKLYQLRDTKLKEFIREAIIEKRDYIAELNRDQLWQGKKADGSEMPEYKPNSKQPNAPGKIVLFDTGDFHEGIEAQIEANILDVVGTDEKTSMLVNIYGEILGLNEGSLKALKEEVKPIIEQKIARYLKIKVS